MDQLRSLPNVEFLGQVEPERAEQIIAEAALLLSTSSAEGFPNTFLQAWANGTPVVTLSIDPDNVIQNRGLGAVAGGIDGAIANIEALVNSPKRRQDVARSAQRYIAERHTETVVIQEFSRALCSVH